ncbi:MAG: hypothetical protein DIU79_09225 [Actinobacteria bacterium]|nr:MAG: hypothetical protein DIU79_09225 [Actinomycetota bacterium]
MADRVRFTEEWRGLGGIFGGRVIAALGEAAQAVPGFDVLSLAVEFSGSVGLGEAEVAVSVRHKGSRTASVETELIQGHPRARAVAKLARVQGEEILSAPLDVAGIPAPADLARFEPPYRDQPWTRLVELRLLPRPEGAVTTRTWARLAEESPAVAELDAVGRAAVLIDAMPPALFFGQRQAAFVPTIDFTLYLRPKAPASPDGWYLLESSIVWARDDFCMEDISLFTSAGEIVAQARQNRRVVWATG